MWDLFAKWKKGFIQLAQFTCFVLFFWLSSLKVLYLNPSSCCYYSNFTELSSGSYVQDQESFPLHSRHSENGLKKSKNVHFCSGIVRYWPYLSSFWQEIEPFWRDQRPIPFQNMKKWQFLLRKNWWFSYSSKLCSGR